MSKPFDATLNSLIDARPEDWVAFLCAKLGIPAGPAEAVDTDLSATVQADKVFRLKSPRAYLHLELEANHRLGIPADLMRYNVLIGHGHTDPVHSVLLLLRPGANATDMTGNYVRLGIDGQPYHTFTYTVVRLWQEPLAPLLAAGPGLAPLAMLTDEAADNMPAAFTQFTKRLRGPDVNDKLREELLGSTYVLCGMRHNQNQLAELYKAMSLSLEDSTTYQWILKKGHDQGRAEGVAEGVAQGVAEGVVQGAAQEARRLLLLQGRKRFKSLPPTAEADLQSITDAARLERMAERIFDATDWNDLIATT